MDTGLLLLELGGTLLVLALAARLALALGLSPIPLYLVIGLAFGDGGIYPLVTAEGFIEVAAEIGVVLLLFMLGLEYTPAELMGGLRSSWVVATVDLIANFTPGLLAGLLLGWTPIAAVVLGGVTYISSSGIAAKVIDDRGWFANAETPGVLSLLVAEDLVMAVYLPILGALLAGGGAGTVGVSLAGGLLAAGLALFVALRFGGQMTRLVASPSNEALLLGVLGVTLVVAGAAERVHVSAAIGAFLVGIAFSDPVQERARGLVRPLRDLFAATFFVLFGLQVDPRNIPPVLGTALALAVVTAATKGATAWWGARRAGLHAAARRRAAAVLLARGEFSIVVAEIGVAAGLTAGSGIALGPVATAYVLVLAVAGPLAVRLLRA